MAMINTFNTVEYEKDVYSMFNHIKDHLVYSKKNNIEITILNMGDWSKFYDYTCNLYYFSYDKITTIAWEMAKATAHAYNNLHS